MRVRTKTILVALAISVVLILLTKGDAVLGVLIFWGSCLSCKGVV